MVKHLFFSLLFLFVAEGYSQDSLAVSVQEVVKYDMDSDQSPMELDDSKIEDYKNDDAFNYTQFEEPDNIWQQFKNWIGELWNQLWSWLIGDYEANGFIAFIIRMIPYMILFGILIFVGWLFYRLNPGSKILKSNDPPEVFFTEEEEIIKTKDIKKLIQKALENHDYRLAVRYYYLLILKKLGKAELISYEFDKTNSDYVAEIASEEINTNFKKVTLLYDYIWYGSFEVTETDFRKAQQTFTKLEHQIPKAVD